jgi:parallel beta-helix repeat protein
MEWQTPKTNWQAGDVPVKDDFNRIEGNTQKLQADLTSHTGANSAHSATPAATPNRLMMRDSAGRAKVAKPVAGDDVARKDTVDVVQSNLDAHKAEGTQQQHAKTARFVIGTSTAGWTAKDCHYLCDGTADQVEINAAIQALPATGGEVVILDGTYNITAKIDVTKDNVNIRGNGNATVLKRMFNSSVKEGVIMLTGRSDCKIANLQVDGNKTSYANYNNYGIYLADSSSNTITGNTCNNNYSGIYLADSSSNTITGNTCDNNNNYGICLYSSSSNNTVTGNTCYNNNYGIYLYSSSSNNTVTGNTCDNNNNYGIYLADSSDNTVTGNTCYNNKYGIYLYSSSSNNTVTGNTCNNNSSGIYLYSSSNNTVTGNTCIRGTGLPTDYTASQYTMRLGGTGNNYNLIAMNNCMGKAVANEGGTGNSVWGNKWDAGNDLP